MTEIETFKISNDSQANQTIWKRSNIAVCDDAGRAYYYKLSWAKLSQVWDDQVSAAKFSSLELENKELRKVTEDWRVLMDSWSERISKFEAAGSSGSAVPSNLKKKDEDVDVELLGSDEEEEDEEKARITAECLKACHEKKSKKLKLLFFLTWNLGMM